MSLLSNVHLLFRVPSFSRWPLELRFFSPDVHKSWLKWSEIAAQPLRDSISIVRDFSPEVEKGKTAPQNEVGSPSRETRRMAQKITALDIDNHNFIGYVKKTKEIVEFEREGACAVCHKELEHDEGIYTICPHPDCETVTHMTCLSRHFLEFEKDALVPTKGTCPGCKTETRWVDVVKELSLRVRGQKEIEKLLKEKRARKGKAVTSSHAVLDSSDSEDDEGTNTNLDLELKSIEDGNAEIPGFDPRDSWHDIEDSEASDKELVMDGSSKMKATTYHSSQTIGLRTVIEDSDWDEATGSE